MKYLIALFFGLSLISCSESTSSSSGGINIKSGISSQVVKEFVSKNPGFAANEVDSISVSRIRVLISEIKVKIDNSTNDKTVKAGPFLLEASAANNFKLITSSELPNGTYDKIKFEFHRFSESESLKYEADTTFKDFATGSRYSAILEGKTYKNGVATSFIFYSQMTANLSLNFDNKITISDNTWQNVNLEIMPAELFKKSGDILNPLDGKNENDISNNLKSAIKALKK